MRLSVKVHEGRNLPAMDLNGFSDPYVKLQLGKQKQRSKVVKRSLNPVWGEEFTFMVDDLEDELIVSVMDEDKYFNDDFIGQVRFPVSQVFDAVDKSLKAAWYPLLPKPNKRGKFKDSGDILLTIAFTQATAVEDGESESSSPSKPSISEDFTSVKDEKIPKSLAGRLAQMFNKNCESSTSKGLDPSEFPESSSPDPSEGFQETSSIGIFEDLLKSFYTLNSNREVPSNLSGGILVDQSYIVAPQELNSLIFSPDSTFPKSLAEFQGNSDQQTGSWKLENGGEGLKRVVSYVKPPTKLIKAVKASEEQSYIKADGNSFAVLSSVSTPDVMYGSTFKIEILYSITSGPELPSSEQTSHLTISWRMNFLQSTIMKGMIENGARQGLKDNFDHFASLLSQSIRTVKDSSSSKNEDLDLPQVEQQSDWKLAKHYLANFTVFSTVFTVIYVLLHIWLSGSSPIQGLEFAGLDLPDSIGEIVTCGVLVLQLERILQLLSRFMQARIHKGSDHGIKAQGDGWLLTIALIEGSNLAAVDTSGFCDPYVVFSCNGKTKTSSIKFQKSSPLWNEIFEFDAMDEPPSVLNMEVYDFDGPFDEAASLGHAEVNFLKSNSSDLADIWIPLRGSLAQACHSKLHLRIFLNNTRGSHVSKEYLVKMEKQVGKKINLRSPQATSAFQKLFGLPSEEFLINDFTCHLKRKMPLQGRLFLSARIIGFHANLFGHKTTFYFLWEDVEDIEINPPSLWSMGSPIIVVTLWQGKGMDAKHGARTQDDLGRLKFNFHSFVSFNNAQRTILALWRARSLSPEQRVKLVAEESETRTYESEESGLYLGSEELSMSDVYSVTVSVPISFLMELFGGESDRKIMEKVGCLNYSYTPWETEKPDVYERQLYYRLDKRVSGYRGEVTSTQQKMLLTLKKGWLVQEVMNLHGVPLGDHFNLHLRYQIEDLSSKSCKVCVSYGVAWLKSTKHQKRITKNIVSNLPERLKIMFGAIEKEFLSR